MSAKEDLIKFRKAAEKRANKLADDEHGIKILLEKVRSLFFKYGLVGDVSITKSGLMVDATLTCEIDGTTEYIVDIDRREIKVNEFIDSIALNIINLITMGIEKMLNDMIFRSKSYWNKSYKDHMTLSGNFAWSDPKGYFSMSVSCSATVKSMHDYLFSQKEFELTYGFPQNDHELRP